MKLLHSSAEIKALADTTGILFALGKSNAFCLGRLYPAPNDSKWISWIRWDPVLDLVNLNIHFDDCWYNVYALTEKELQFFEIFLR